jgi:porin
MLYRFITVALCLVVSPVTAQTLEEETLPNPDAHELSDTARDHLLGTWGGLRTDLLERGVRLDLHYLGDTLWNLESSAKERAASFNRVRGTVDIDFGTLADLQGLTFHATAVWQGGGNLGTYLGLVANPSALASMNTLRLDSWWFEKRWLKDRIATRIGQFAGQDSYGHENFGKSFVFEPIPTIQSPLRLLKSVQPCYTTST